MEEIAKKIADMLIDKEAELYKIYGDDPMICVGIKKMADEVRELYDGGILLDKLIDDVYNERASRCNR